MRKLEFLPLMRGRINITWNIVKAKRPVEGNAIILRSNETESTLPYDVNNILDDVLFYFHKTNDGRMCFVFKWRIVHCFKTNVEFSHAGNV